MNLVDYCWWWHNGKKAQFSELIVFIDIFGWIRFFFLTFLVSESSSLLVYSISFSISFASGEAIWLSSLLTKSQLVPMIRSTSRKVSTIFVMLRKWNMMKVVIWEIRIFFFSCTHCIVSFRFISFIKKIIPIFLLYIFLVKSMSLIGTVMYLQ